MYGSQPLVPSSMINYPTPLYHHPSAHRFSLSPTAGNSAPACPQNYYGSPKIFGTYDGLFPPNYTSDPCKQALMMASHAAGFSGMSEYSSCMG